MGLSSGRLIVMRLPDSSSFRLLASFSASVARYWKWKIGWWLVRFGLVQHVLMGLKYHIFALACLDIPFMLCPSNVTHIHAHTAQSNNNTFTIIVGGIIIIVNIISNVDDVGTNVGETHPPTFVRCQASQRPFRKRQTCNQRSYVKWFMHAPLDARTKEELPPSPRGWGAGRVFVLCVCVIHTVWWTNALGRRVCQLHIISRMRKLSRHPAVRNCVGASWGWLMCEWRVDAVRGGERTCARVCSAGVSVCVCLCVYVCVCVFAYGWRTKRCV